jgi:CBS domain-containing protein
MMCRDVMKTTVESLSPSDSVRIAAQRMRQANIGFLPVCDARSRVVGTLTDRDITIRLVAEGRDVDIPVSEVMTKDVISCRPDDDIKRAHALMGQNHKSRLVCCEEDGELAGVISLSDIATCTDASVAAQTLRRVVSRAASA